eukprot:4897149-Amphidinium_carterae.1
MTGCLGGRPGFRLAAASQSKPESTSAKTSWMSASDAASAPAVAGGGGEPAALAKAAEASATCCSPPDVPA